MSHFCLASSDPANTLTVEIKLSPETLAAFSEILKRSISEATPSPENVAAFVEALKSLRSSLAERRAALTEMLKQAQTDAVGPPSSGSHPVGAGVGKRLRRIRWKRGMTQDGLAFQAGVDRSNISAIESGKHMPREFTLVAIAKALNCNYLWLITGAGAPGVDLETEGPSA